MSLYYETAAILENKNRVGGSLKSRVYGNKDLRSSLISIYALASKATQWADVLKDVIERSGLLSLERKLTPYLALLLSHDLLLSKEGVAAPKNHVLTLAISRHKARLTAELNRLRVKRGCSSVEELKASLGRNSTFAKDNNSGLAVNATNAISQSKHLRWIRVSTLKTSLHEQLCTTFKEHIQVDFIQDVFICDNQVHRNLYIDPHIPDLIALSATEDFTRHSAYRNGSLILQDKASCFPAYLLNPHIDDGDLMDACAAPGNKTTHLAALVESVVRHPTNIKTQRRRQERRIFACERDAERTATLTQMIQRAGATSMVDVLHADFLALQPSDLRFANITALLLDPSCSGSGMLDRTDVEDEGAGAGLALPSRDALPQSLSDVGGRGTKRKRKKGKAQDKNKEKEREVESIPSRPTPQLDDSHHEKTAEATRLQTRLASLSAFQTRLLTHAFHFPAARRVVYSTCSIHIEENEAVVQRALTSEVARERGWRVLRREQQVDGLKRWDRRGESVEGLDAEVVEACIRCAKGTGEGTMGFFVCGFVRGGERESDGEGRKEHMEEERNDEEQEEKEEWEGFGDDGS